MASGDAAQVGASGCEATIEIKIKTLDSQTYNLRVDKCVPVPDLKEQIAGVTGVLSEQQRLICRGKVLKDDQLLSAYHVEDGHTLHLVVREPPQSATPSTSQMGSEDASTHPGTSSSGNTHNRGSHVAHSFVLETVNVDQGDMDTSVVSRIISSMLDSIASTTSGTGNIASDIRDMITERLSRASNDSGPLDSAQPHPNRTNTQRARREGDVPFTSMGSSTAQNPTVIPDSLTTLSQYMELMRDEFRREGFGVTAREHRTSAEETMHLDEGQSRDSHFPAAQVGLPTPASLAEVLTVARQLLMEQTGDMLSQLAGQLGNHATVTDPAMRMNMQSSAITSAGLMRNLGSLLLELGRTTMTLRMGQTPAEAVVNAGPANFVSATGPNPLMVQAAPFFPGSAASGNNRSMNSSQAMEGEAPDAAFIPRNIEIRIRTARAVPVASANASEQTAGQQQQERTDATRNSSAADVLHQTFSGGDSGVRVVPLRTVVAVPSGVSTLSSDSLASSVRLFYPLLARVRQAGAGNASEATGSQASPQTNQAAAEADGLPVHQPAVQREDLASNSGGAVRDDTFSANTMPFVPGLNATVNESGAYPGISAVFVSSQQSQPAVNRESIPQANGETSRGASSHDEASDDGLFLSNVLRQLIPLISQGTEARTSSTNASSSSSQIARENSNSSSGTQHQRDPPDAPSPKRAKREGD